MNHQPWSDLVRRDGWNSKLSPSFHVTIVTYRKRETRSGPEWPPSETPLCVSENKGAEGGQEGGKEQDRRSKRIPASRSVCPWRETMESRHEFCDAAYNELGLFWVFFLSSRDRKHTTIYRVFEDRRAERAREFKSGGKVQIVERQNSKQGTQNWESRSETTSVGYRCSAPSFSRSSNFARLGRPSKHVSPCQPFQRALTSRPKSLGLPLRKRTLIWRHEDRVGPPSSIRRSAARSRSIGIVIRREANALID